MRDEDSGSGVCLDGEGRLRYIDKMLCERRMVKERVGRNED